MLDWNRSVGAHLPQKKEVRMTVIFVLTVALIVAIGSLAAVHIARAATSASTR